MEDLPFFVLGEEPAGGRAFWALTAILVVVPIALFVVSWTVLHVGVYKDKQIIDTPVQEQLIVEFYSK